jgi:hypothetical protein
MSTTVGAARGGTMEIAPGIHRFGSRLVNWYIVEEGSDLTLVDTGFRAIDGCWTGISPT